ILMPQIRYEFVATGAGDIGREFRSISAEARASKAATDSTFRAVASGASRASSAAQAYGRDAKRPISEVERLAKRVAAAQERAAKRAADTETREAQRAAREKAKAHEHVFQIRQRYEAQMAREETKRIAATNRAQQRTRDDALRVVGRLGKGAVMG